MHFEITASQQAVRKPLTTAQRNSSLFSEAPRIGATTLRRGQVLKFDESQMKQHEVMLKRLFDAGAIEIVRVDGKVREDFRALEKDREEERVVMNDVRRELQAEGKEEPPAPPPSAPKAAPVVVEPPPAPEPVPEAVVPAPVVVAPEPAPVQEEAAKESEKAPEASPAISENKGKKGKR